MISLSPIEKSQFYTQKEIGISDMVPLGVLFGYPSDPGVLCYKHDKHDY